MAIENDTYRLKLHDLSGMLDEVTLKAKPEYTFVHKKETNGAIQWNPGCYAPPRAWVHVSDWKPGEHDYAYEEVRGPVVFRTRRWGQMPMMPEITVSMEYEFYAGAPYFVMRSSMHLRHEVAAQALRNAEVVFAREAFSEAAWWDAAGQCVVTQAITSAPDLTEWTMPDTTPWVAFFDRDKGCGYGGIQMDYMNGGLDGRFADVESVHVRDHGALDLLDPGASVSLWEPEPAATHQGAGRERVPRRMGVFALRVGRRRERPVWGTWRTCRPV